MKLNDRVAVYGMLSPKEGGSVEMSNGKRGLIIANDGEDGLTIFMDEPVVGDRYVEARLIDGIHPKQCRLLVKKRKKKPSFFKKFKNVVKLLLSRVRIVR